MLTAASRQWARPSRPAPRGSRPPTAGPRTPPRPCRVWSASRDPVTTPDNITEKKAKKKNVQARRSKNKSSKLKPGTYHALSRKYQKIPCILVLNRNGHLVDGQSGTAVSMKKIKVAKIEFFLQNSHAVHQRKNQSCEIIPSSKLTKST